jgi:hypothetical protein
MRAAQVMAMVQAGITPPNVRVRDTQGPQPGAAVRDELTLLGSLSVCADDDGYGGCTPGVQLHATLVGCLDYVIERTTHACLSVHTNDMLFYAMLCCTLPWPHTLALQTDIDDNPPDPSRPLSAPHLPPRAKVRGRSMDG